MTVVRAKDDKDSLHPAEIHDVIYFLSANRLSSKYLAPNLKSRKIGPPLYLDVGGPRATPEESNRGSTTAELGKRIVGDSTSEKLCCEIVCDQNKERKMPMVAQAATEAQATVNRRLSGWRFRIDDRIESEGDITTPPKSA